MCVKACGGFYTRNAQFGTVFAVFGMARSHQKHHNASSSAHIQVKPRTMYVVDQELYLELWRVFFGAVDPCLNHVVLFGGVT